jgi:hypothetical protein
VILAAAGKAAYAKLIDAAVAEAKESGASDDELVEHAMDNVVSRMSRICTNIL